MDRLPVGWDEGPGLVASVWRYRWLVAAVALAGALAGVGFSLVQPVAYEASSRVLLTVPSSGEGGGQVDPGRFVRNESEFMVSPPVLDRAVRMVKGRVTVKQLRQRLVAEPSAEADLVTLRVRDATAQGAAELVDAVGHAYEATAVEQAQAGVTQALQEVQETQRTLRGRLEGLDAKLRAAPGDRTLRSQREAVVGLLDQAVRREQELQLQGPAADPVALLERAEVPESPAQPKPLRLLALGGLLGLVLAAGLAWWLAGRRQAAALAAAARPTLPQLPRARPAGVGARLGTLRSRLPSRRRAAPDVTTPASARAAHARERLRARLTSERRLEDRPGATVALSDESDTRNGHHPNGNGSGKLRGDLGAEASTMVTPRPDEANGEAPPP